MAALIIQVQGVVKTFKGTQTWKQFPAMKWHAEISGFFKEIHMTNVGKIKQKNDLQSLNTSSSQQISRLKKSQVVFLCWGGISGLVSD